MSKPIVGVSAIFQVRPPFDGPEGSGAPPWATLKNSKYSIKPKANVKTSMNTSDGINRAVGLHDFDVEVEGELDFKDPATTPIEVNVKSGDILDFRAFRSHKTHPDSHFWAGRAIFEGTFETGADLLENWKLTGQKQSGVLTYPDGEIR